MSKELIFMYSKIKGSRTYKIYKFWQVYFVEVYEKNKLIECRLYTFENLKKDGL